MNGKNTTISTEANNQQPIHIKKKQMNNADSDSVYVV